MSRSRKKTSICGVAGDKRDRWWKRLANRVFRRREREAIYHDGECPVDLKEVSDVYNWPSDGKEYFDPEEHMELMRK